MREIKFRVWAYDKMLSWDDLYPMFGRIWYILNGNYGDYEVMQYTGLKDKNGKEIYEGDILSADSQIIDHSDPNPYMRIIEWDEESGQLALHSLDHRSLSGYSYCKKNFATVFQIIGNVYENPELLNGL